MLISHQQPKMGLFTLISLEILGPISDPFWGLIRYPILIPWVIHIRTLLGPILVPHKYAHI